MRRDREKAPPTRGTACHQKPLYLLNNLAQTVLVAALWSLGSEDEARIRKDTIARRVRYAAPVFPNDPVEDCAPLGQALERTDLVSAHEAAVAFHIRCEDCNEASAD
jgi:hypothetical protein